ncbi:MAG: efflux RND transporter periplasmic adaptor subunit [Bacteroidales bacterium]|nr:efflux RND transporter periplasmic adaptor subunit [Bacteroidales bacterium]MCF8391934.1 efflux RND transporter periplasmic adaptor subunit [Bacteroidales bacterium]
MNNRKLIITILIATFFVAYSCKQPDLGVSATIEVPVGVIEVSTSSLEEFINTTATVYPIKEVSLSSEMAGKYNLQINPDTRKPYALGDKVSSGEVIIKLEDEEYSNGLRIKSKEVDLEISAQEYEKQKSLYEKGGATLRELKNAEIGLINSQYDAESSRINLAKMTVSSPFAGVISELPYYTNGTKVNVNTLLVKLIDYSSLYLETNLPEKYFVNVEKGLKVYITSYTHTKDTLIGKITQISPAIDPEARTFKCFVNVENKNQSILPGMFVKADLVINSSENTIVIPKDIIVSKGRDKFVFVVEKGVADMRLITTGLESERKIEVLSGLEEGESLVIRGYETLRENSRVKVLR